jgi:hypothetical protein
MENDMELAELAGEIVATYQKHNWTLRRVLLRPETRAQITADEAQIFGGARIDEASIDALWFSRPSYEKREAWELRLLTETQYALFQTFEKDEPEEAREEIRREMETRLLEYVTKR